MPESSASVSGDISQTEFPLLPILIAILFVAVGYFAWNKGIPTHLLPVLPRTTRTRKPLASDPAPSKPDTLATQPPSPRIQPQHDPGEQSAEFMDNDGLFPAGLSFRIEVGDGTHEADFITRTSTEDKA